MVTRLVHTIRPETAPQHARGQGNGLAGVGEGVVRLHADRLLEAIERTFRQWLGRIDEDPVPAFLPKAPGRHGAATRAVGHVLSAHLRLKLGADRDRDLVLYLEEIIERPVETLCEQRRQARRVDELDRHPHLRR